MAKKMTHAEARSKLYVLSLQKMMIWFDLVGTAAKLAHDVDDDCVIAVIGTFNEYRNVTLEYDRKFKELTS